ncbi:hypothetical protein [Maridesulfovibrio bastinii]|nr:hypothetical protein [Maridesulfovibrio bastinii]
MRSQSRSPTISPICRPPGRQMGLILREGSMVFKPFWGNSIRPPLVGLTY